MAKTIGGLPVQLTTPALDDKIPVRDVSEVGTNVNKDKYMLLSQFVLSTTNQTISGAKTFSSAITATGGITSGVISLDDDSATSITPPENNGLLITYQNTSNDTTIFALITFRAAVGVIASLFPGSNGSNVAYSTSALTGTTGADGAFTYSVNDGKIYFENRRGGTRSLQYTFLV